MMMMVMTYFEWLWPGTELLSCLLDRDGRRGVCPCARLHAFLPTRSVASCVRVCLHRCPRTQRC